MQTGEELVVVTVPNVPGAEIDNTIEDQAKLAFAQHGVRGTLLFIDLGDHRDAIIAQPQSWFSPSRLDAMRASLNDRFREGEYDTGLADVTAQVLTVYREHGAQSQPKATASAPRLRVYGIAAAAVLAYLLLRAVLRWEGR